jgi:hypothetical protein
MHSPAVGVRWRCGGGKSYFTGYERVSQEMVLSLFPAPPLARRAAFIFGVRWGIQIELLVVMLCVFRFTYEEERQWRAGAEQLLPVT